MMLDTNALSAWAEGDRALLSMLPGDRAWMLPSIVLGEFRFGVRGSQEQAKLERWLAQVEAACVTVAVDAETAVHYAEIRSSLKAAGTPIPENDVWIAALCRQHSAPLATRDRHFDTVAGLRTVGW